MYKILATLVSQMQCSGREHCTQLFGRETVSINLANYGLVLTDAEETPCPALFRWKDDSYDRGSQEDGKREQKAQGSNEDSKDSFPAHTCHLLSNPLCQKEV